MSMTYNIQCEDCKETLWVGQSKHIYTATKHIEALQEFLHRHKDHNLKFVDEDNENHDYKDLTPE